MPYEYSNEIDSTRNSKIDRKHLIGFDAKFKTHEQPKRVDFAYMELML